MIYAKWLALCLIDWAMWFTVFIMAPIISAFTRSQPYDMQPYTWGWLWGTYDNPPQGDEGFVRERAPFPGITSGFKGYVNRIMWMIRNPLYGMAKRMSVEWSPTLTISHRGNPSISDKYEIPGWYFAKATDIAGRVVAFELYAVLPWGFGKCLRARLGWKIMTDKFQRYGFAPIVNTANPIKSYG